MCTTKQQLSSPDRQNPPVSPLLSLSRRQDNFPDSEALKTKRYIVSHPSLLNLGAGRSRAYEPHRLLEKKALENSSSFLILGSERERAGGSEEWRMNRCKIKLASLCLPWFTWRRCSRRDTWESSLRMNKGRAQARRGNNEESWRLGKSIHSFISNNLFILANVF